ncbi:MAG: carboxypeptidase-like regulatory domain-containing protein, partial [Balneolaceae bacterium]|nr:carboxypeptidase-like regulatory domain-containing protein [Balneolaceae bacterium]
MRVIGAVICSFLMVWGSVFSVQAQNDATVSGTVTEAGTGEPLPGVNVIVRGTTIGASTNAEGNFELTVPSLQDTLVFSFVGFQTQQVPINGRTEINVELQTEAVSGEELVVVGYGMQQQESIVGAISSTSSEQLERTGAISNLGASLTGQIPGVTTLQTTGRPGEESLQFLIRGQSSWTGGEPLILVDGVERSISNIDRSEVANISVLK